MQTTIISHDVDNGIAVIRFEQDGIVREDTYDLVHVVPGTTKVLKDENLTFTLEMQLRVIEQLETVMQNNFDSKAVQPHLEGNRE
jgi:hypothetical protein